MASSSSSLQPDTPTEQESASSSSTPLLSSSSFSNTSPEESQQQRHVHFATILKQPRVVGLRPQLCSSVDEPAKNSRGKTMFTCKATLGDKSMNKSSEKEFESENEILEFANGKGNGRCREYDEKEKDKLLSDAQCIISRLRKERRIQRGEDEKTTNLKIRIAVLENELPHAKSDKEAVEKSLGILIESMARVHFSLPPEISKCQKDSISIQTEFTGKGWETEIEILKEENKSLRTKNRELDDCLRYGKRSENGCDFGDPNVSEDQDKEKKIRTPTPTVLAGSWGPTEPSTSISTSISNPEHADVGLHSLDDLLGDEDDTSSSPNTTTVSSSPSSSSFSKGKEVQEQEEAPSVKEQLVSYRVAMQNFNSAPKPSVIKVGFAASGSFRGSEYDTDKLNHPITHPRGPRRMRDYDRFGIGVASTQDLDVKLGVFNDREERDSALNEYARLANSRLCNSREQTFPEFFRHGIFYTPGENEKGYLRTVHIGNLPNGIHLRDVLARVRGGDVLSAIMLDTRRLTGGMTVRVVFKTQQAAEAYTVFTADHPVIFKTNEEDEMVAEITILSTPTFPVPANKKHHLKSTRCLRIPSFPPQFFITHLERLLGGANAMNDISPFRKEALLELWLDESQTLHLQFSSIENAVWAWDVICLQRLPVECELDPCAGDVKELLDPLPARPPMLPRHGQSQEDAGLCKENRNCGKDDGIQLRKHLVALSNQKVDIPSFGGEGIKGRSWADEVEEEEEGGENESNAQAQHIEDVSSALNARPLSPISLFYSATPNINIHATHPNNSTSNMPIQREWILGPSSEISSTLSLLSALGSALPPTSASRSVRAANLQDLNTQATDHHRQFSRSRKDYRGGLAASCYAPVRYEPSPLSRYKSGVDVGSVSENAEVVDETEMPDSLASHNPSQASLSSPSSSNPRTQNLNQENTSNNEDLLTLQESNGYDLGPPQVSLLSLIASDSGSSSEEHDVEKLSLRLPHRGGLDSSSPGIQARENEEEIFELSYLNTNTDKDTVTEAAHQKNQLQQQNNQEILLPIIAADRSKSLKTSAAYKSTSPSTIDEAGQAAMRWYGYGYGQASRDRVSNAAGKGKEEGNKATEPAVINPEEISLDSRFGS